MSITKSYAALSLFACSFVLSLPAQAQFSVPRPYEQSKAGAEGGLAAGNYTIAVYPESHIDARGGSRDGLTVAADAIMTPHSKYKVGVGAWYWANYGSGSSQYELHANVFFTPNIGIQGGYLAATNGHDSGWDGFVLYNYSSLERAPSAAHPWAVQLGLGGLQDNGADKSGLSTFVTGSYSLNKSFDLLGSYWYTDVGANSRYSIGVGYRF